MNKIISKLILPILLVSTAITAQNTEDTETKRDSLPPKVLHAEPLYIDLIRDLGARKGEREWNLGVGLTDNENYDEYTALIEYEWAPMDRLGLEIELPFSLYYPTEDGSAPGNNLNSIKMAGQYSFLVSEKHQASMAIGYIQEFTLTEFNNYGRETLFTGLVYNTFLIAAKRLGSNFHSLIYTGPVFDHHFNNGNITTTWQINSNIHYMIPGTRNFIGVEFNKEIYDGEFDMTIRPQMRVDVSDHLLVGIVTGIPIDKDNERFSSFLRLIYEP
ncbi:phosphoribosylformylglycinamidine synthase [Zunongwangia sp. SCSIO 43204]|uniref:HAEPLYID family protein n=1 Tax=Zunongwangia sp. SCSIO 43204 TaxID=2779359 RepID=UPI001CA9DB60|nr:HAEPLYID family protein [Zunongwangia sp. SCSIO 43204]UAB83786.1 phosphoribosylformylglycinamidine synthase [Zunongwangia sp. SCSIO 43204]